VSWLRTAVLVTALLPRPAWAAPPPVAAPPRAEPRPQQGTVLVLRSARPLPFTEDELLAALGAQLRELDVEVRREEGTVDGSSDRRTLAMLYIEFEQQSLVLHLFEPEGTHLRARQIPFATSNVALLEEIASVVRSAISALLDDAQPSKSTEPAPQAKPPLPDPGVPSRPVPDSPPEPVRVEPEDTGEASARSALRVGFLALGTEAFETRPFEFGLGLELRIEPASPRWFVSGTFGLFPQLSHEVGSLTLLVTRSPITLAVGHRLTTRPFILEIAGGFLAERLTRRVKAADEVAELSGQATHHHFGPLLRLELGWRPSRGLVVFGAGGVDTVLRPVQYEMSGPGTDRTVLLRALSVRPHLAAGLRLQLF